MSTRILLPLLAAGVLAASSAAQAQFTGPSVVAQPTTVAAAAEAREDTYVTLTGQIVNRVRDDYYTFRDSTGEIRVEIEAETWRGRKVGPGDRVRIMGEVERDFARRYVEVETLEVL